ncbi:MAG: GTP-binding protein [Clostridia bacterium]|nr:GTP-binding protein [Clostridia bacterium]
MKIDIFSGFLGAGKTTLIKKLLREAYKGEKVVLIENEFGEIGIDGGFLEDAGVNITEMNSGCICCSLVGDFAKALKQVAAEYAPDRIIIEPSGVRKLSDVIKAVKNADLPNASLNAFCTVVDASKCKMYMKNFGEFFGDQVENAGCIVLSHTSKCSAEKLDTAVDLLREKNFAATIVTTEWSELDGKTLLAAIERKNSLQADIDALEEEHEHHHEHHHHEHHHEHHEHERCCCGHHHEHDHDHCHEHEHHHEHDHDHHHEHHHEHGHGSHECDDPHCCCHHDHHDHEHHHEHGHHHADDVFTSWGLETTHKFTQEELENALQAIQDEAAYGTVLRAKGIVAGENEWWHFDYVPGEPDVRKGSAGVTGRLCVIGCNLNEQALKELFKA